MPTKQNPAFGLIAPTPYLNSFATQSNFHLALAHLIDVDEEYTAFYKSMSDRGDFIICDNGAFELGESYAPDRLIELGNRIGADALVLPDFPFRSASKTITESNRLVDIFKEAGFQTMFVPQSKTGELDDWISGYEWAANNDDIDIIGMSILGIPNAIPHCHIGYARVLMTQILIERGIFNFDVYHHYLGLNSGPGLELPTLMNVGVMDSCDSSGPIWAGICNTQYSTNTDSLQSTSKISHHVDFNYPLTSNPNVLNNIQVNIDLTLDLFKR